MKVPIHPGSLYPYMVAMTYQMSQPWVNQALIGVEIQPTFGFPILLTLLDPNEEDMM